MSSLETPPKLLIYKDFFKARDFVNYYQTFFLLGVDTLGARCYNVRYVNGIFNIYFCVRGRCAWCARICAQGILAMSARLGTLFARSAGVGTLFARQNPCQTGRSVLVILHNYFGNIYYTFRFSYVIIALLIRWANQFIRRTYYV